MIATSSASRSESSTSPRIIIHGGCGNINRENLPPALYAAYRRSLLSVLRESAALLSLPTANALDVAVHAVALLEDDHLFNCGRGAVFARNGTIELEASVMVSRGYQKRGVGAMTLRRVKNPIRLAREMLVRGEKPDGGGAGSHCQLSGEPLEELAAQWGCEMRPPEYFWTKRRWDEHKRGLDRGEEEGRFEASLSTGAGLDEKTAYHEWGDDSGWDGHEFLPQGTVGAVVLDRRGSLCVATSTGGLTNKLPGRIGDTPTIGAGFWAEEWQDSGSTMIYKPLPSPSPTRRWSREDFLASLTDCLPTLQGYRRLAPRHTDLPTSKTQEKATSDSRRAVAVSGTGNGDSFLRTGAARTAGALCRFSFPPKPFAAAVSQIAGPGGELQRSAGDRWGVTGEGEGGMIGIELINDRGRVVQDFNCGGMFRAWVDDYGHENFLVFKEPYKGPLAVARG